MSILNSDIHPITLEYVYFPLEISKPPDHITTQLQDGDVSFLLDFHTLDEKRNVESIGVCVMNTTSPIPHPIPNVVLSHIQDTKILVKVDLNSVSHDRQPVYRIRKRSADNLYRLHVDINLFNGATVQQSTRTFELLQGNVATTTARRSKPDRKRGRPPVEDARYAYMNESDEVHEDDDPLIETRDIVCEYIKTKCLTLDGESIIVGKTIHTPNGDIAYHFLLENDDDMFEEGEVVGIIPIEEEGERRRQTVSKLTFQTASHATIKGVVTRSQYLEAMKPSAGVRSETVAMMGIVPVQVRGRVYANEPLYASPRHPGYAVSATQLDHTLHEAAFVGYAFSSRQADNNESRGLVQAAVSVLQSCGQKLLSEKVNRLKRNLEVKIKTVDQFSKRTRTCVCASMAVGFTLSILVCALLWQLLTPGSALRYYQCAQGRRVPHRESTFSMQPLGNPHLTAVVNGIEFEFDKLIAKAGHEEYPRLGIRGVHYYLNIDRCAYGYVTSGDVPTGRKRVRGPTVFAVDKKCFRPYYFDESSFMWTVYNSSSWMHYQNICCTPNSEWKTCAELKASSLCSTITKCQAEKEELFFN